MEDIMVQPFLIQNNTLFLTKVIDTEILIRSMINMFYLFISLVKTIMYLGLLLIIGICNLCYHIAEISMNNPDCFTFILVELSLFVSVIYYFYNLNKKIEKEFERKFQKIYLLNEDNYYRINELHNRLTKLE